MNKKIQEKWVARLRSGTIEQGHNYLGYPTGERCCLGVLCDIAVEEGVIPNPVEIDFTHQTVLLYGNEQDAQSGNLPEAVLNWAGLPEANPYYRTLDGTRSLAGLNDDGSTFEEIASIIENCEEHTP